ncbi:hypothetical protein C8J57DRAFT_1719257 [Mycena rebaudengoi]|nr:hypothetical protein C8J57DRAFT_1719257 [Mycena rebaudengoi]
MQSIHGPCGHWSTPPTRVRRLLLLGAVLALSSTVLIYYSLRGGRREWWADSGRGGYENLNAETDEYEYVESRLPRLRPSAPGSPTQITCFPGSAALKAFDAPDSDSARIIDTQTPGGPTPRPPAFRTTSFTRPRGATRAFLWATARAS